MAFFRKQCLSKKTEFKNGGWTSLKNEMVSACLKAAEIKAIPLTEEEVFTISTWEDNMSHGMMNKRKFIHLLAQIRRNEFQINKIHESNRNWCHGAYRKAKCKT